MKSIIIKFVLLILALSVSAPAQKTKTSRKQLPEQAEKVFHNLNDDAVPLFVFSYISPWRKVYGSDSPEFVLYQDGSVIFTKCREKDNPYSCYYLMAKLSAEEISETMEKLRSEEFYSFDAHYSPDTSKVSVTDLTYCLFVMRKPDGTYKKVSTYGALSGDETGYVAENVPNALKEIVAFINSYNSDNSSEFRFEYMEVLLEPYNGDSKKTINWSKGLPDLNDIKTIKHKNYGRYSLFVHNSLDKRVSDVIYKLRKAQRNENEAALFINNRRWKVELRFPFPSEVIWLGKFRD